MAILETQFLTKKYGGITAVNGLNLTVNKGDAYGLLGPNGSGKTTTLGMVLGVTRPTSGDYTWFGGELGQRARLRIGTLLETPNFYPYMSAARNLSLVAHIKKVERPNIDGLLELVNLRERRDSKFSTYSLGMKQRLAIAAAMVGDPEVLILDEPTNGLDPAGIVEVRETIIQIAKRGKTIIMASHILDEVEKICSHVAILQRGKLLESGRVGAILTSDRLVELASANPAQLREVLASIPDVKSVEQAAGHLIVTLPETGIGAAEINRIAFEKGITLTRLLERKRSLESEFLEITGTGKRR